MKKISQPWDKLWFALDDAQPVSLAMPSGDEEVSLSEFATRLFGRVLSDAEYVELVGAQPGNSVRTGVRSHPHDRDYKFLAIERRGSVLVRKRRFHRFVHFMHVISIHDHPSKPSLVIEMIEVDSQGQKHGIATHLLARQVFCARRFGFSTIYGLADNRHGWTGYVVFPKLGFDCELSQEDKDKLPLQYSDVSRLSELITSHEGFEWWKENGWPIPVEFDTAPDSSSVRTLAAVFAKKKWTFKDRPYVLR